MNQHLSGTSTFGLGSDDQSQNAELRVGWKVLKRLPIVRPKGSFRKLRGSSPLLSPAWMCANNQDVNLCRMKVRRNVKTKDAGNTAFFVSLGVIRTRSFDTLAAARRLLTL